jgi:hypothetical protein
MTDDDRPDADEATPEAAAKAADRAYQEGFDAGCDGIQWVRAAIDVLMAEIDPGDDPRGTEARAVRDMRTAAADAVARLFHSIESVD